MYMYFCWSDNGLSLGRDKHLRDHGYVTTAAVPNLWRDPEHPDFAFAVIVDDFAIKVPQGKTAAYNKFVRIMEAKYTCTHQHELTKFLGTTLVRDRINKTMLVSAPNYIAKLVMQHADLDAKPQTTPRIYEAPRKQFWHQFLIFEPLRPNFRPYWPQTTLTHALDDGDTGTAAH